MTSESPFHEGEQQVQRLLGVREEIEPWARKVVHPFLPEQHREFYAGLPFLVAAARDREGRPWATLLTGPPGFAHSPEAGRLGIGAGPIAGDALEGQLEAGSELGLLGIELATRRRNRVNGRLQRSPSGDLELSVDQAFGNCPQYIHEREWHRVDPAAEPARRHTTFSAGLRAAIEGADTFFIATGHRGEGEAASFGMDASHRGGPAGFVKIEGDRRLVFPDYAGNNHFNTIGNLVMDPRVGILFVDFERGSMLQLTGRAVIDWNSPAVAQHPGARRLVVFDLEEAVELPGALPLCWDDRALATRPLRLAKKVRESDDVRSFHFEAADGGRLEDFEAGQHLPIELEIPGETAPVRRTYSLSGRPGEAGYRLSVKREPRGVASRYLHDHLEEGDVVNARVPAGAFVLPHGDRPVVLLSAGIGVTPMLSMLASLVAAKDPRPVWFLHGARDGAHHAHAVEIRDLVGRGHQAQLHVSYTRPASADVLGQDYNAAGRLDAARVAEEVQNLDADFFLCGPPAFMAQLQEGLESLGVPSERIHAESFGPVG